MPEQINRASAPCWVRRRLAGTSGLRWVGIDGFGAAGKSTLAASIANAIDGVVVAADDFGRMGVPGWDRELFTRRVLEPLLAGTGARYQTWDLITDRATGWAEVDPGVPVVFEGVSSTDNRLSVPWDLTLWVEASAATREQRIIDRDGPELAERWRTEWLPSERAYVSAQRPWERVSAVVVESEGDANLDA